MSLLFIDIYYNVSQALLGYITINMRAIAVKYPANNGSGILVKVYLEREATPIDKENIFSALFEAEGMLSERVGYDIDFIVTTRELTVNDMLDFWIYMRYEDESVEE